MRWLSNRYLRATLALLGLGFIVYSLVRNGIPLDQLADLSLLELAVALGSVVGAVLAGALAWAAILEKPFSSSGRVMLESLPAKYVPGGLGLPLSQLNFETRQGDPVGRTVSRMVQNFVVSVSAGGTVALVMHLGQEPAVSWQVPVAVGLALALPLAHPSMIDRLPLPNQARSATFAPWSSVGVAFGITFVGLLLLGLGFQSVLGGMVGEEQKAAAAFVLAWSIGFAVVPVPAGLGLRESALVAMLAPLPGPTVVLAAVLFRLIAIIAELVVSVFTRLARLSRGHLLRH